MGSLLPRVALAAGVLLLVSPAAQALRQYPSRHFDVPLGLRLKAADVNGDGAIDLLGSMGGGVAVHENLGQFRFAEVAGRSIPPTTAMEIVPIDLDGNGVLDLVIASEVLSELIPVRAYVRVGGLYREEAWRLPGSLFHAKSMLAGDVDADGDQDLVLIAALSSSLRVLRNDGTGRFSLDAAALAGVDAYLGLAVHLNGDRAVDLVLGNSSGVAVLLNNGQGQFVRTVLPGLAEASGLAAADFDADGDVDVVATARLGAVPLHLFVNAGNGNLTPANQRLPVPRENAAEGVAALDADRDGDMDLAVGTMNFNSELLLNNAGTFVRPPTALVPRVPRALAMLAADLDADGAVDLVVQALFGTQVWKNTGGAFAAIDPPVVPGEASVFADLNGDGDPDAIGATFHADALTARSHLFTARNDGSGRCAIDQVLRLPADWNLVLAGDIDGDRDNDVVTLIGRGTAAAAWQPFVNDGRGGLTAGTPFALAPSAQDSGSLVDLDADGDADVLRHDGTALESTPAGFVARPFAGVAAVFPRTVAADIDGDGLPEIFVLDGSPVRVFRNLGGFAVASLPGIIVNPPSRWAVRLAVARGGDAQLRLLTATDGPLLELTVHTYDGALFQRTATAQINADYVAGISAANLLGDAADEFVLSLGVQGLYSSTIVVDHLLANVTAQVFANSVPRPFTATVDLDQDGDLDAVGSGTVWRGGVQAHAPFGATLGSEYRVEFPSRLVMLALLGLNTVKIGTPFGTLRVDPSNVVVLPVSYYSGTVSFNLPNVAALRGVGIAVQGFDGTGLTNLERRVVR